ncbi:MAG: class I SAM-dependent methyltransferase [Acidobacteriota bacterium]|nr:class I SAM-dependent methyltransferase [Acidobacteriota bacterium]
MGNTAPEDGRSRLDRLFPRLLATAKALAYRTPVLRAPLLPRYPYWVDPGTLAEMIRLIDEPRTREGAIVEVGVARGITSVFLLEHLRTTGDPRPLVMIDTFSGFTAEDIRHETAHRDRRRRDLANFSYGSACALRHSLKRLGYRNFRIIAGDCATVDWREIGPIAALLCDVDLYQPTLATLEAAWPLLLPHGGIVVDDCVEPHWADGSLEALLRFIKAKGLPFQRVGGKAARLTKRGPRASLTARDPA